MGKNNAPRSQGNGFRENFAPLRKNPIIPPKSACAGTERKKRIKPTVKPREST